MNHKQPRADKSEIKKTRKSENLFNSHDKLSHMAESYDSSTRVVVLRLALTEDSARSLIERKKDTVFGSVFSSPKKDDVQIQDLALSYECLRTVSGSYAADYLRNATHTLRVDKSVRNVIIGDASFDVPIKSRIQKALSVRRGSTKINIDLKEHVYAQSSLTLTFDASGSEIKPPKYKITSTTAEVKPADILDSALAVKRQPIERADAVAILEERLKAPLEDDIEDLNDQFDLDEIVEMYVPIFEARLRGPRNKVAIIRVDAARKKII